MKSFSLKKKISTLSFRIYGNIRQFISNATSVLPSETHLLGLRGALAFREVLKGKYELYSGIKNIRKGTQFMSLAKKLILARIKSKKTPLKGRKKTLITIDKIITGTISSQGPQNLHLFKNSETITSLVPQTEFDGIRLDKNRKETSSSRTGTQDPQNLGIFEYSGIKILVPGVDVGDNVKVKITKIFKKIAFATVIELLEKGQKKINFSVGTTINVKIIASKEFLIVGKYVNSKSSNIQSQNGASSPAALARGTAADLPFSDPLKGSTPSTQSIGGPDGNKEKGLIPYYFIIPINGTQEKAEKGEILSVVVTRLKKNYGFAKTIAKGTKRFGIGFNRTTVRPEYGLQKSNIILPKKAKFFGGFAIIAIRRSLKKRADSSSFPTAKVVDFPSTPLPSASTMQRERGVLNPSSRRLVNALLKGKKEPLPLSSPVTLNTKFSSPKLISNPLKALHPLKVEGREKTQELSTQRIQSILLFIKLDRGAQLGDNVRIKISQIFDSASGKPYAFAKVLKVNKKTAVWGSKQKVSQSNKNLHTTTPGREAGGIQTRSSGFSSAPLRETLKEKSATLLRTNEKTMNLLPLNYELNTITKLTVESKQTPRPSRGRGTATHREGGAAAPQRLIGSKQLPLPSKHASRLSTQRATATPLVSKPTPKGYKQTLRNSVVRRQMPIVSKQTPRFSRGRGTAAHGEGGAVAKQIPRVSPGRGTATHRKGGAVAKQRPVLSKQTPSMKKSKVIKSLITKKKQLQIKENIQQMLKYGMHFGEKALKCQAKMRDYIWISKKGKNKNRPFIRKGRHYLNLLKTRRCLKKVSSVLAKYAAKGRTFLFVGTKKPSSNLISRAALFNRKSFFVNTRWLGGMLTNWKTILKSISKIRPILKEKQKIIKRIIITRQAIKLRLLKKILTSMKYIKKGKQFLETIKKNLTIFINRNQTFSEKRKKLIQKGQLLLSKRKELLEKRKGLFTQSLVLKEKGFQIINSYQRTLILLLAQRKKLKELKTEALLWIEFNKIKKAEALLQNVKSLSADSTGELSSQSLLGPIKEQQDAPYANLVRTLGKGILAKDFKSLCTEISDNITKILRVLTQLKEGFKEIKKQMSILVSLKKKVFIELRQIKTKLIAEQKIIKLLKNKIKRCAAEKKFLKILPKCKQLADPDSNASSAVQILMQKFVDPKIKQATASLHIYDDKLRTNSKKIAAARKKKWLQLEKYFGGVANMLKMNKNKISKNVAIIIGQQEEMNAVRECQKLGIQMFHVVDTNCNPTLANHIVPANDESRHSIKYILTKILRHIRLAQKLRLRLWKSTISKPSRETQKRVRTRY